MEALIEAFDVNLVGLVFQVINFLLLLYLLNRFLFKPLLGRMDERSAKIGKGLEDAEAAARDRELARAEREAAVAEARKEAQEMIARATKIAEDSRNEIVAEARSEAEKVTQRAREEITAEKDKAMGELRDPRRRAGTRRGRPPSSARRWTVPPSAAWSRTSSPRPSRTPPRPAKAKN